MQKDSTISTSRQFRVTCFFCGYKDTEIFTVLTVMIPGEPELNRNIFQHCLIINFKCCQFASCSEKDPIYQVVQCDDATDKIHSLEKVEVANSMSNVEQK